MRAAFLGLSLLANKLWRMHGSVSWSQWGWMQWQWGGVWEQLCRLETVNNRELSYYTFCCSVSPDSLSFSLPSASHSFSFTSHIRLSLSPYPTHTPTYLPLPMFNHTLLPCSLTLPLSPLSPSLTLSRSLPKISRYHFNHYFLLSSEELCSFCHHTSPTHV